MTDTQARRLSPDDAAALRADALAGLTATPRSLPPRWFYDARGSELFDAITRLPEYYPTRAERAVLPAARDAESTVDSALLAALVFGRGPEALGDTVREVGAADPAARLNLLAADGTRLLATTWGDTLSVLVTDEGTALASEPWDDDPAWTDVPDRSLVEVTPDGLTVTALT